MRMEDATTRVAGRPLRSRLARAIRLLAVSLPFMALAFAAGNELPADPRFDQPVTIHAAQTQQDLANTLVALARSVGLTAVTHDVPTEPVRIDIPSATPFRELWALLLTLHGLSFSLLEDDLIVVAPSTKILAIEQALGTPEDQASTTGDASDATDAVRPTELRTFRIEHAQVEVLAATLERALASLQESPEKGFTLIAEVRTNQLIAVAEPSTLRQLETLLEMLDMPRPTLQVRIRIQEIHRSVMQEWGLDLMSLGQHLSTTIHDQGLALIFNPYAALTPTSLEAMLHALERQDLARRLDEVTLLVNDHERATFTTGGTLTRHTTSAATEEDAGSSTTVLPYGFHLDVTPQLTASGQIRLALDTGISDLVAHTEDTTQLTRNSVQSVITLTPGDTLILGGLSEQSHTTSDRGIPILRDLPLLGSLFGVSSDEERSREVLILITADFVH